MAKRSQSFAEKVAAASEDHGQHCPECGELFEYVKYVGSTQNPETSNWKFNQKMVAVCKCNKSEVLG